MRFQYILYFLLFGLTCFTACDKQNIEVTETKEEEHFPEVVTCNLALNLAESPAGTLNASVSNGLAPYSYVWSTGDTTSSISVDTSGSYTVTVTDNDTCVITGLIDVLVNNDPCLSLAVNLTEDSVGTLTATATGGTAPYIYAWATGQTSSVITIQSNGTYLVSVTDVNGCVAVEAIHVTSFSNPCGGFGIDIVENPIGTLTASGINGTSPYSYAWSTGETTSTIIVPDNGFYNISITDALGCSTDTVYQVVGIGNPCATLTGSIMYDGAGTLTANVTGGTGVYSFTWSTGATTSAISVLTNGTYTLTIIDLNTGCTFTTSKFVTVNDPCFGLSMNLVSIPTGGTHTLQSVTGGTPPYTYQWSNGSTMTYATIYTPGTYTVWVTDAVGCVISEDFVVQ